ncbi:MAG: ABC transporter ATP-binding protein, partial [Coprobacillus sp.]|nr:ABC transporter ATP-binding protein [Coprobacillus sp.]
MPGPMGGARGRNVNVSDQKAKHLWRTWGRILVYSKKLLIPMGIALVFSITASVLSLIGPTYLSRLTDAVQEGLFIEDGIDMSVIVNCVTILVTIYAVSALVHIGQSFLMADVTVSISRKMRGDISQKINVLPMKYFNQHTTGDILSRVTNDVDTIGQSLNMAIGTLFGAITLFVGAIIMMFVTNWIMALVGIAASIIGFAIMMIIMSRSQKYYLRQQKHLGEIDGHIEEVYSGHTIVRAYNGEDNEREKFETMNNNLRQSNFRANSLSGLMMPLMTFIGNLAYVAVCVVGAVLTKNGTITIGVIVAFMVYVRLFTSPLSQIAQAFQQLQSAAAAGERVFEFLDEEPLPDESQKPRLINWNTHGDVVFDHVQFGYEDTNKIVIHDLCA